MAYTTFATLYGQNGQMIDFQFELYTYRVYIESSPAVYGTNIRMFLSGKYNELILEGLQTGQYGTIPTAVGSNTYEISALTANNPNGIVQIQRERKNTAPTQPGAFTQPTGELEIGDTRIISWGASTDAEGNLSRYVLETSVNGGAYTQIAQPTTTTYSYTIPTATSLKFRVKAVDTNGLESPYRESPVYTVTKPKYYWSKYNIDNSQKGSLVQTGIIAIEGTYPINGIQGTFWYERNSRVNQTISPTGTITAPAVGMVFKPSQSVAVTFTASTAPNISLYEVEYRYNNGLWTTLGTNNISLTRVFTTTTTKTLTNVQFRVRAKNTSNVYSDYVYSEIFNIEHNTKPTISLTTVDNKVLTENTTLVLSGQAVDTDNGNVLSIMYQIGTSEPKAIIAGVTDGSTPITYSKTLTFKDGKLYDGTTALTNTLVAGQTYTVKVYAEDNQGGKSDEQVRSFTVIPNRPPTITVNAVQTTSNLINNDTITITGSVAEPEGQNVVVKYKINDGTFTQLINGVPGTFSIVVKLSSLTDGDNIVQIEAADTYNSTAIKKLKIKKTQNKVALLKSTARYKVDVPAAGITGIVSWIEREIGDLTVAMDSSMKATGEIESFTAMTKNNTAPVSETINEEQYSTSLTDAKSNIAIRINLTKSAAASDKGITKITGALQ